MTIPNQLTLLRILLTPVFIYLMLQSDPVQKLVATVIFIVAALTDWYDGWYARRFGVITRVGQFMDPLADKILVSSALIVFAMLNYVKAWMVLVILIRDALVTANRLYALAIGRPIITHVVAKWKTAAQMFTILEVLFFINYRSYAMADSPPYTANYHDFIGISMLIVTVLTLFSGIIYIYENRDLLMTGLGGLFRRH